MNIAEAIAFCALIIGIISVTGILFDAYKGRQSERTKQLELKLRLAEAGTTSATARAGEIEERLRVLERIATDRKHSLADEIESLRGKEIAQ